MPPPTKAFLLSQRRRACVCVRACARACGAFSALGRNAPKLAAALTRRLTDRLLSPLVLSFPSFAPWGARLRNAFFAPLLRPRMRNSKEDCSFRRRSLGGESRNTRIRPTRLGLASNKNDDGEGAGGRSGAMAAAAHRLRGAREERRAEGERARKKRRHATLHAHTCTTCEGLS